MLQGLREVTLSADTAASSWQMKEVYRTPGRGLPPPPGSATSDPTQGPEQLQRTGNFTKSLIFIDI